MKPDDVEPPLDLSTLARSSGPPRELEPRVVDSLRARGLLRPATNGAGIWRRYGLAALAAAALLAIGFVFGDRSERRAHSDGPRYLLLLYQDSADATTGLAERDSMVAEYVRWAGRLREDGRLVLGEELGEGMAVVPEVEGEGIASSRYALGGFFVIHADDLEHAIEIARSTPHARGGGAVVVRPINPT